MVDHRVTRTVLLLALVVGPFVIALAQEGTEARSTGLPSAIQWKFNLDAAVSFYSFGHSLYTNPHDEPTGNTAGNWFEGFVKAGLSATYGLKSSEFFGKLSVVGERTHGVAGKESPGWVGGNADSYYPDDAYLGWRSGKALPSLGENAVEFIFGRSQFTIGHGFLIYDGAGEGGSRGGYWSNARKAFALTGIARLNTGKHKVELFYLDKDELPEVDSKSRLFGANYELSFGENLTIGATYMRWMADENIRPERNGLDVYDFRLYSTPVPALPLSFEGEYAFEDNGDALSSNGWYAQASYEFKNSPWSPRLSYRYAFFQGDDPSTAKNEAFDPLFLGFYDWGAWWQGEIAGEYFISNSNMKSHQIRLHTTPTEEISTGLIGYIFKWARPASVQAGLTTDNVATEIDWYTDWKLTGNLTASIILAWSSPGEGVKQVYDRTKDFTYMMLYLQYSY